MVRVVTRGNIREVAGPLGVLALGLWTLSFVEFFVGSLEGFFPLLGFPMALLMETGEAK
jgi:hypothetical protein